MLFRTVKGNIGTVRTEFLPKALWAQMVKRLCRFLSRHEQITDQPQVKSLDVTLPAAGGPGTQGLHR